MDRVGKYQIVEKIGAGGFSEVYKGFDPLIKRHVAIKTCTAQDAELRSRFFQEAEIAGRTQHRNIVTVFDFGFEREMPYLVQEYLTGEDLDRKVKRGEAIDLDTKLDLLHQIALGLAHAHELGIIHRDIKPGNIRILEDGTAKIMDFGIAKFLQEDTNLTKTGMTVGTAAYLAPEQIRGHAADPRTDVFSFGVLAYELLTLSRPFAGEQISAVLYQILNQEPHQLVAKVPDCPPMLADLVMRCLMKAADDRPANGARLVKALESVRRRLGDHGNGGHDAIEVETVPFDLPEPGGPLREIGAAAQGVAEYDLRAGRVAEYDLRARRVSETIQAPVVKGSVARKAKPSRAPTGWLIGLLLVAGTLWLARGELMRSVAGGAPTQDAAQRAERRSPDEAESGTGTSASGEAPGGESDEGTPNQPAPGQPLQGQALKGQATLGQATGAAPLGNATNAGRPATPPPPTAPPLAPPPAPQPATLMIPPAWDPTITVAIDDKAPRLLARAIRAAIPPGHHRLHFRINVDGYRQEQVLEVEAQAGKPLRVNQPFKPPGSLIVQAKPGGLPAVVLLDGQKVGDGRNVELGFVAPGDHQIAIQPLQAVAGARSVSLAVSILAGQATIVTYDLESMDEPTVRQRGGDSEPGG